MEAKHVSADQCEMLLEALNKRNLLTHTYDEKNELEAKQLILHSFEPAITCITEYLIDKKDNESD